MTAPRLVIVGAGGHAKVVLKAIDAMGRFEIAGLVDPNSPASQVLGRRVLGTDTILTSLHRDRICSAVVAVGDNRTRERVALRLLAIGFELPSIVHPSALVSPTATLGAGTVGMARAVIGTETTISDLAIINTGAIIDHDNVIGRSAHIAPGSALAGRVRVGERALVGVGSAIRPGVSVGADAIIGAGSSMISDVPANCAVGGSPARPLSKVTPG